MPRERTDSITQLVKIVAEEVFDKKHNRLETSLAYYRNIVARIEALEQGMVLQTITNELMKVGDKWSSTEDSLLVDSLNKAIEVIATAHGRTPVAIRSRIEQKRMLY